ncbi:unannotated protein [freshwater metagenome]|uniref:Unannotated protein n=1 Tax=freshwater metagenome TaxID=449393 RepID=A0A6J7DKC5_9ZZZZ|nr:UDP-N-acetylmuramoyl-L-alanine--D-glutamate ligase [Actinomycetota bacterium]
MSRPRGFADLAGHTVGVWGVGVEGSATRKVLDQIGATVIAVDDAVQEDSSVLQTTNGGLEALQNCDIVIKSPGIPRRRDDVLALEASGVPVTSATGIWLAGTDRNLVIGVTGTKGKSTTTSLITFMLRACGVEARSAGNIGLPPFLSIDAADSWTVLEVSSFQAVDITDAPGIVVLTTLGEDHVDWHGSLEQYRHDKLQLTRAEGHHLTVVPDDPELLLHREEIGGELVTVVETDPELSTALGLVGAHNARNVALALRATACALHRTIGDVRTATLRLAATFEPLPGRLTLIHRTYRSGLTTDFVDDGLATNPLPVVAAVRSFPGRHVALIVGGYDRGVDYRLLAQGLADCEAVLTVIAMGEAGARISDEINRRSPRITTMSASDMATAVTSAAEVLNETGGVVLFSPGAPSFDHYQDWRERSADFTKYATQL